MVSETELAAVRSAMLTVRVPNASDKVFKTECLFSFDTVESPDGLYINMRTFECFGRDFVQLDSERTGNKLYYHIKDVKIPKPQTEDTETGEAKKEPTKLAIGVEGGFMGGEAAFETISSTSVVVLPEGYEIPLPCQELPEIVIQCITGITAHSGGAIEDHLAAYEEEPPKPSKYAENLIQVANPPQIPPGNWRCAECGTGQNLWLNLSDGFIGCGRKLYSVWDGCVGGQEGAAIRHYQDTGCQYPLAVKLGTITAHTADVYSYAADEDTSVEDPYIAKHLAHFGINIQSLEKTEKTMTEMSIEHNIKYQWDRITEANKKLIRMDGPGYIGLKNLGNSCYMNSIVQVLCSLPEAQKKFFQHADEIFKTLPRDTSASSDFLTQLCKLCVGLLSDRYPQQHQAVMAKRKELAAEGVDNASLSEEGTSVSPGMFKSVVGKGHYEFSSGRQQDACEYYQHLINSMMAVAERLLPSRSPGAAAAAGIDFTRLFKYYEEHRYECPQTNRVKYKFNEEAFLLLPVPVECATNKEQVQEYEERKAKRQKTDEKAKEKEEEPIQPRVPFKACIDQYCGLGEVELRSEGRNIICHSRARPMTFPPYLWVVLKRFYQKPDWTTAKLEALVEMPSEIDLEMLRGKGPQPDETELPSEPDAATAGAGGGAAPAAAADAAPDEMVVAQLMSMGYSKNAAKRASLAAPNATADAALEWLFGHMDDPDLNDPPVTPQPAAAGGGGGGGGAAQLDDEKVANLMSMGFEKDQAECALLKTNMDVERAVDWLFSHTDTLAAEVAAMKAEREGGGNEASNGGGDVQMGGVSKKDQYLDGDGKYSLVGFVTQMGSNLACGHYVAHINKDGKWVVYNDRKVAISEEPPFEYGYMYLYRRKDYTPN
ncbi:unnamed protein product [Vitrella brassicaformis CCMP3155]|uniref:Ubiquitin carboxyl-terminal hydrolase 14 n=3 Tax=Vitrella brassicaformis TaxID=1169539 RepID=A0A0G4FM77_VITBC|nr:unnamed protein product [Vitrella brassicaformis CCMP3155]|eukprot:CEM14944.1 unnamed protein product [Vitrella brassicaformis CCMP3155]